MAPADGMKIVASEMSNPPSTAGMSSRLEVQPSAPGHTVELRQAKAFAIWPRTTVRKAAPDAASSTSPVG